MGGGKELCDINHVIYRAQGWADNGSLLNGSNFLYKSDVCGLILYRAGSCSTGVSQEPSEVGVLILQEWKFRLREVE